MQKLQNILSISKRTNLIVALFVITFYACDNSLPKSTKEQGRPIIFNHTSTSTKAGEESLGIGKTVGVFAYYLESKGTNEVLWNKNALPSFMYNQEMITTKSGQLSYSPIKYWPSNQEDKIKFFSYSPHSSQANGNNIILSPSDKADYPTLNYTPNTDISKQTDLLVAVTEPLNSGGVKLNFKHALTQLSFSAQCINNLLNQAITITSIKLSNVANGNGQFTETGFEWTASTTTQDYTLSINQSITGDTSTDLSGSLYLVPQTSTCKLDIELMVGGIRKRTPQRDISTSDWAQGKKINYLLTINLSDLIAL